MYPSSTTLRTPLLIQVLYGFIVFPGVTLGIMTYDLIFDDICMFA